MRTHVALAATDSILSESVALHNILPFFTSRRSTTKPVDRSAITAPAAHHSDDSGAGNGVDQSVVPRFASNAVSSSPFEACVSTSGSPAVELCVPTIGSGAPCPLTSTKHGPGVADQEVRYAV